MSDLKQLMDDALAQLRPSPSLASDAIRSYGRQQRRRKIAGAVTAAAVAVSAVLLWSVGGSSPSGDARLTPVTGTTAPSGPTHYVAKGILLTDPQHREPLNLCGAAALSLPPQCSLVPLRGVDINTLPSVRTMNGVTWTDKSFRVVGTYSGGVLTATERPTLATYPDPTTEPAAIDLPCSPPAGGWTHHMFNPADAAVLSAYGAAHPDTFGGLWTTHNQQVGVVTTTGDLATARRDIRRTYSGNLCVAKAEYSDKYLRDALAQFDVGTGRTLGITMTSVNSYEARLDIGVVIENAAVTKFVKTHFPAGLVRVSAFLVPVN